MEKVRIWYISAREWLVKRGVRFWSALFLTLLLIISLSQDRSEQAMLPVDEPDYYLEADFRDGVKSTSISITSPLYFYFTTRDDIDMDSLQENLRIEPEVDYTVSRSGSAVTIHPRTQWVPNSSYTITIDTGYVSKTGRQFAEPQVLTFRVTASPSVQPNTPSRTHTPYPFVQQQSVGRAFQVINDARSMSLYFEAGSLRNNVPVVVETYKLPDIEKLYQQGQIYIDYDIPLDLLERVDANVFLIENGENRFDLPHQGAGGYIVATTYTSPRSNEQVQKRVSFLVTPLSVYMQASVRDTLVWINSSETGGAAAEHKIYFDDADEPAAVTDRNGMAIFDRLWDSSEGNYGAMVHNPPFRIYDQSDKLVYYDNGFEHYDHEHRERYYSYLFLDRTLYRPEDTVSFWGFVQPFRNNQKQMPDTVTITFDPGGLELVQELQLNPNGTFHGEIELERIRSSQYNIQASFKFTPDEDDQTGLNHVFETRYISVKEYQKPAYVISSSVDRDFYGPHDSVTVTAAVAFYDGTPLPSATVEASYYDAAKYQWVTIGNAQTDAHGNATFSFPAWAGGGHVGAGLTQNQYMVRIASDGEDITHIRSYNVFPSDILMDARMYRQTNGQNVALTMETYALNIDSDALKNELSGRSDIWLDNSRLLQLAKGERVDVSNIQIGLSWDFVDQRNMRRRYYHYPWWPEGSHFFDDEYSFDYIIRQNPDVAIEVVQDGHGEKLLSVSTVNGSATINNLIYLPENTSINWDERINSRASFSFQDTFDNARQEWGYYYNTSSYWEDWSIDSEPGIVHGYSFAVRNLTTGADITSENYYHHYVNMDAGDTARFSLLLDSEPVGHNPVGRMLYSIVQDGVFEHYLVSGNSFDLQYKLAYGTGINLVAVYFDGQGTTAVKRTYVNANNQSLGVHVEVTPDRESYRPGDTVRLSVRTTNSRGAGVASNVCVAVVDEAIFALSEQHISVLSDLYYDVRWTNNEVSQYLTAYRDEEGYYPQDGGKGGSESLHFYDSYRSNFRDTATFLPVTTNASGNAHLTFQLPDNTTSWRITTVAIGNNFTAGQAKDNIISTLPFFVKPVMSSKYIDGDDFAVLVQGHGTLLSSDSDIEYVVTVIGDGYRETKTAIGKAYLPQEINFGKLPVGSYTIISRAQHGGYSDTVELPVSVIKSNLELVINREIPLSGALDIEATRFPVTLTFYDQNVRPFIVSINSLFGHYCMQTNQRLSRVVAKQALRRSMPGEDIPSYIAETSEKISDMQNADGGIGYHIGGTSDLRITTYVLLTAKEQFDLKAMAGYFKTALRSPSADPITAALSHLGLAVIGDELMTTEFLLTELEKTRTLDVKAYYIAAIAAIGETETALELYKRHCTPHIAALNTSSAGHERDTAAVWIAATLLRHEDADTISMHFGEMPWRISTLYEAMIYVTYFDKVVEPSMLTYTVNGQPQTIRFGLDVGRGNQNGYMRTVVLSRSEVEGLQFTSVPENVRAIAYYIGEPTEMGLEQSDNMSILKSIRPVDDATYEVTLRISLGKNAPLGQYDISDWVPSNTRIYSYDDRYEVSRNNVIHFDTRAEMQNLYISFNNQRQEQQTIFYKYRVRKTFSSEAALDTVYMIHGDTGENCNSSKSTFRAY